MPEMKNSAPFVSLDNLEAGLQELSKKFTDELHLRDHENITPKEVYMLLWHMHEYYESLVYYEKKICESKYKLIEE